MRIDVLPFTGRYDAEPVPLRFSGRLTKKAPGVRGKRFASKTTEPTGKGVLREL